MILLIMQILNVSKLTICLGEKLITKQFEKQNDTKKVTKGMCQVPIDIYSKF